MEFDTRLKEARLTRKELARLVGVSVKATYNWSGNPPKYVESIITLHEELVHYRNIRKWQDSLDKLLDSK